MDVSSIGKRIREQRKANGLTLEDLAKAVGVSRQTIFRYENGTIENIPIIQLFSISKKLNVSTSFLLGLENEKEYEMFLDLKHKRGFLELLFILQGMDSQKVKQIAEIARILQ